MSCTTYGSAQGDELLKKSRKWFMCSTIFLLHFLLCHLTIETWLLDKISHQNLIAEQIIHIFVLAQRRFLHQRISVKGAACRRAELPSMYRRRISTWHFRKKEHHDKSNELLSSTGCVSSSLREPLWIWASKRRSFRLLQMMISSSLATQTPSVGSTTIRGIRELSPKSQKAWGSQGWMYLHCFITF
jgi:hypothetical protein